MKRYAHDKLQALKTRQTWCFERIRRLSSTIEDLRRSAGSADAQIAEYDDCRWPKRATERAVVERSLAALVAKRQSLEQKIRDFTSERDRLETEVESLGGLLARCIEALGRLGIRPEFLDEGHAEPNSERRGDIVISDRP